MNRFRGICSVSGVRRIFPYATQSLRGISNASDVCDRIKKATGLSVRIISGEDEARLGCEAFLSTGGGHDGYLTDLGGGSTEINLIEGGKIIKSVSLPFGSRSLCRRFGVDLFPGSEQAEAIRSYVVQQINESGFDKKKTDMFACGGTSAGMFKLYKALKGENVSSADVSVFSDFFEDLKNDRELAEKAAREYTPDRFDTVYTGMLAHMCLCFALGCEKIHHTKTTCRRGYAEELIRNGIIK